MGASYGPGCEASPSAACGVFAESHPSRRFLAGHFEFAAPGDDQKDVWILRFADPDCGEAVFTGEDAEGQAWAAWNRYAPSYNCWVFRLARLSDSDTRRMAETEGLGAKPE